MLFSFLANYLFSVLPTIWPSTLFRVHFAVIQDVDNASLEGQYQSFASLMEQRLAELFVLAGQQGTRFRRATAVGSFTVQVRDCWHRSPEGAQPRPTSKVLFVTLMKALVQQFLLAYIFKDEYFMRSPTLIRTSAHACMITCGQPLLIREFLSSSSANCSSKQARGGMFYKASTVLRGFSSHLNVLYGFTFCFPV